MSGFHVPLLSWPVHRLYIYHQAQDTTSASKSTSCEHLLPHCPLIKPRLLKGVLQPSLHVCTLEMQTCLYVGCIASQVPLIACAGAQLSTLCVIPAQLQSMWVPVILLSLSDLAVWLAVENERLTWELSQLQGLVDADELARLRTDIDTLRQQILQMHAHSQVTTY